MPILSEGRVAIGALLALSLWIFVGLPLYYDPHSDNATHQCSEQESKNYGFWEKTRCDPVAYFTLWLVAFTGVLSLSTIGLWVATRDSVKIAKAALTDIERAFVFSDFDIVPSGNNGHLTGWTITPKWKNGGNTRAKHLYSHVSWDHFPGALPEDFTFPDLMLPEMAEEHSATFIPAGGVVTNDLIEIPVELLDAARMGFVRIFIWGWTEYDDIFERSPPHRTEFCNEIVVTRDPYNPAVRCLGLRIISKHTGADGDCYRQARPANKRHEPFT